MPTTAEILADLEIEHFDDEIFLMSRSKLRRHFSFKSGGIDSSRLIRNLIWQDHQLIQAGQLQPFRGNLRSYWYSRIKPVLARARARRFGDKYPMMIRQFVVLVVTHRLMDYRDFGFRDEAIHQRHLGLSNAHILCVAEKIGHMALLDELHRQFEVSVYALGGQPSALSTETFIGELRAAGYSGRNLTVISIVDYDPSGASIAKSFLWQMQQLGFSGQLHHLSLVHPSRMTPDQIRLHKFPLPKAKSQRKKNERWANATGGLSDFGHERLSGLEVDAMTWTQIIAGFQDLAAASFTTDPADIARARAKRQLAHVCERLLFERLLR